MTESLRRQITRGTTSPRVVSLGILSLGVRGRQGVVEGVEGGGGGKDAGAMPPSRQQSRTGVVQT